MAGMLAGMYSCKREIPKRELLANYEVNNFSELFHVFWTGMNTQYQFWDKETVNWDSMYRAYKPKFDSLSHVKYTDTAVNRAFQFMADMTKDLHDGQYYLTLASGGDYWFEDSLYRSYYTYMPKLLRANRVHANLPDTLFDHIIQNNYLNDFDYGVYKNYSSQQVIQVITGNISKAAKNLEYMSINDFMMKESYDANYTARPTRPVIKNFFDKVHKSAVDGVIIDLRNNRGGNLEDIDFLVGQFTDKPVLYGYARHKSGAGRLDYTPALPLNITPQSGATEFKKPIVVLADIYSAAVCEMVIQAFKALPNANVKVIGEHTYGTAGTFVGSDISTLGGAFYMGTFAVVNISNTALMDKNHEFNFNGIAPDVEVKYNDASIETMKKTGIDIQLEKAIEYLNK